jgi:hypothetical protein
VRLGEFESNGQEMSRKDDSPMVMFGTKWLSRRVKQIMVGVDVIVHNKKVFTRPLHLRRES